MSGVEALAVIAAVAAIVSAYKDGGSIVRKLHERRAKRHDRKLEDALVQSLDCSPAAIEGARSEGTARFGRNFEVGDDRATSELWKITAELNGLLLKHLQNALYTDTIEDYASCTQVSDDGRYKSLFVLGELSMRLEQARMLMSLPPPAQSPESSSPPRSDSLKVPQKQRRASSNYPKSVSYFPQFQFRGKSRKTSTPSTLPIKGSTFSSVSTRSSVSNDSPTEVSSSPVDRGFSRSDAGIFQMPRQKSSTSDAASARSSVSHKFASDAPRNSVDELLVNHWTTEGDQAVSPEPVAIARVETGDSFYRAKRTASSLLPRPTADNGYLGLCRGAAAYQTMDLAECFTRNREMTFGKIEYLMCKHCAFTGKIDRAQVYASGDVRLRWAFLAKSHTPQERVEKNMHSYKCLFCIFSSNAAAAPVLKGIDELFRHLASHQNEYFGEAILQQTRCISGEVAQDHVDFDVNLCQDAEPPQWRTTSYPPSLPPIAQDLEPIRHFFQ